MDTIRNPFTGRLIKIGGRTYKQLKQQQQTKQNGGAGAGWKQAAPKKGTERHRMLQDCGSTCFLEPETEGFPVCLKNTCTKDCRGVLAAYRRARQWKHKGTDDKALQLARELNCSFIH